MNITDIASLIPQRHPFIMIDSLTRADEEVSETKFTVRAGHLFVEDGFFTEPGLIENMAQTAGAGTGYRLQQEGKVTPIGFIGSLKKLAISSLPSVGQTISTKIYFLQEVMNVHFVTGKVFVEDKEIASCEFRIVIAPQ